MGNSKNKPFTNCGANCHRRLVKNVPGGAALLRRPNNGQSRSFALPVQGWRIVVRANCCLPDETFRDTIWQCMDGFAPQAQGLHVASG
jgi:hypothetical protein